jgi:ABC-type glycerol-3-phosphate transport system permease component
VLIILFAHYRPKTRFPEDGLIQTGPYKIIKSIFLNLLVILLVIYIAGPFLWVISASFQGESELLRKPASFIPENPTTDNYRYVFTGQVPTSYEVTGQLRSRISQEARLIAPALKNSFIIALSVLLINFSSPLLRLCVCPLRWKYRTGVYNFILGSRLMPLTMPFRTMSSSIAETDEHPPFAHLVHSALTIRFDLVPDHVYQNIPREMEEAGLVDGCTYFGFYKNRCSHDYAGLVAASAFAFMTSYNEFFLLVS